MNILSEQRMLVGLGLLALAAGLAGAGEPVARELQAAAADVNQEARALTGPSHVLTALGALFGVSPETIESERVATRLGFGEIAIAHAIVEATGGTRTFQQVVAMKQSGLGWGQVVHALHHEGVIDRERLGEVVSQVRRTAAVAGALREAGASRGKGKGEPASGEARAGKEDGETHGSPGGPPEGVGHGQGRGGGGGHGGGRGGR